MKEPPYIYVTIPKPNGKRYPLTYGKIYHMQKNKVMVNNKPNYLVVVYYMDSHFPTEKAEVFKITDVEFHPSSENNKELESKFLIYRYEITQLKEQ